MAKKDPYAKLKNTLKFASQAAANNWPQKKIEAEIIKAGYPSMKAFEKAIINHASIQVNKEAPKTEKAATRGYIREVANGITFGLWDKAESLVRAVLDDTPYRKGEGFQDKLEYHQDLISEERKDYQDFQPVISTIGNLAGAGLTGGALYKAVVKVIPALAGTAGAPWWNAAKEGVVEGAIGALEGGLTAAVTGGDVGKSTGAGALIGGVGGPIVGRIIEPGVKYAGQGIKRVKEAFDPTVDPRSMDDFLMDTGDLQMIPKEPTIPEKRAMEKMSRTYDEEGFTPEVRQQKIEEFKKAGVPEAISPTYLGGESTTQLAQDAVAAPGPAKQKVKEGLVDDLEADRGRVQEGMEEGLGFSEKGSPQEMDDMFAKMQADAKPMYDEAYASEPIMGNDFIDETMGLKEFREAYKEASEINVRALPEDKVDMVDYEDMFDDKGNLLPGGRWTVASLDMVKQHIDELVKLPPSATGAIKKKRARILKKRLDAMLDQVDDHSPAYAKARQTWSGTASERDAYEMGMDAYRPGKSAASVKKEFDKLQTPAERDAFRLGASTEAVTKMDMVTADTKSHSKVFKSPENLKKHKILFKDKTAAAQFANRVQLLSDVHKKAGDAIPKSPTAPLLNRFISGAMDLATTGGTTSKIVGAGRLINDPLQMVQQRQTNEALGTLMSKRGEIPTQKVERALDKRQGQLSQEIIDRGVSTGGISGAAGHIMGDKSGEESLLDQKRKQGLLEEEDIW